MHLPLLSGTILRHTYGGWARGHAFARARSAGQPIGFRETAHEGFSGPAVPLAANRLATAGGAARAAPDASRPDAGWAAGHWYAAFGSGVSPADVVFGTGQRHRMRQVPSVSSDDRGPSTGS